MSELLLYSKSMKTVPVDLSKEEIQRLLRSLAAYEMMVPLTDQTRDEHEALSEKLGDAGDELEED